MSKSASETYVAFKNQSVTVKFDDRDTQKPGFKFAEYELKGVPVRIAIGPKDVENGTVEVARRDTLTKTVVSSEGIEAYIQDLLAQIQADLFGKALEYRNTHITKVSNFDEFKEILETKGGFVSAHWDGTAATEEKIKDLTKATIRCVPLDQGKKRGFVCLQVRHRREECSLRRRFIKKIKKNAEPIVATF